MDSPQPWRVWLRFTIGTLLLLVLLVLSFVASTGRLSSGELQVPLLALGAMGLTVPAVGAALLARALRVNSSATAFWVIGYVVVQAVAVLALGVAALVALNR